MDTLVDEHKTRQYWARLERTPDGTWHVLDGDYIGAQLWQWQIVFQTGDETAARQEYAELVARADEYARKSRQRVPMYKLLRALGGAPWRRHQ